MSEEPEAYKIGDIPFLGLTIYLDSHPLIPRVETEWWTEEFARVIKGRVGARRRETQQISSKKLCVSREDSGELRLLDLCAGSGAIGCALLKEIPNAKVYFGEIDPAHETTILKNMRENDLDESRAVIRIGDLFEAFSAGGGSASGGVDIQFDFIASNPPYIPEDRELPESVQNYEPALALRAGADGLSVIRTIAKELRRHLAPNGQAWIECDSEHAAAACSLFVDQGFNAQIMNDQYERLRIIVVS